MVVKPKEASMFRPTAVRRVARSAVLVLFSIAAGTIGAVTAMAQPQRPAASLQSGLPISRTLSRGQSHRFNLPLQQDQFAQIVVDQRGIDVLVRVYSPDGKNIAEFDSPNGANGPEKVPVIANVPGTYSIEVTPLGQAEDLAPGAYEIRMSETRQATSQELLSAKSRDILKAKGVVLLANLAEMLPDIRVVQTRVRFQVQSAQLAWPLQPELARRLIGEAMAGVLDYISKMDAQQQDYYQGYNAANQMRQEVFQALTSNDPDLALTFLRSTRSLVSPDYGMNPQQPDQEIRMEINLASQIAVKNPKRAVEIAEDSLTRGYSASLSNVISNLRNSDPAAAARLARTATAKLQKDSLLTSPDGAQLTMNLLRLAHSPAPKVQKADGTVDVMETPMLSEADYRDLLVKALTEAMSFPMNSPRAPYSPEANSAQTILSSLKSMPAEMKMFAPASIATADAKLTELTNAGDPENQVRQAIQESIYKESLEVSLEMIRQAPANMRDSLYQQLSGKAAGAGDIVRARQIATEFIVNPRQRMDALSNVDRQAIQYLINRGRIEEALQAVGNLRQPRDRNMMITQIVNRVGNGVKKDVALNVLEQARRVLGVSPRAEDQDQLNALIQTGAAFAPFDPKRGFEIIEPLIDQFNDLTEAATILNGFGQQYFQDGELMVQNGNSLGQFVNLLYPALGKLAAADFERSKSLAEKLRYREVRAGAFLAIAQQAINPPAPRR